VSCVKMATTDLLELTTADMMPVILVCVTLWVLLVCVLKMTPINTLVWYVMPPMSVVNHCIYIACTATALSTHARTHARTHAGTHTADFTVILPRQPKFVSFPLK
jgi:hypothetical protein